MILVVSDTKNRSENAVHVKNFERGFDTARSADLFLLQNVDLQTYENSVEVLGFRYKFGVIDKGRVQVCIGTTKTNDDVLATSRHYEWKDKSAQLKKEGQAPEWSSDIVIEYSQTDSHYGPITVANVKWDRDAYTSEQAVSGLIKFSSAIRELDDDGRAVIAFCIEAPITAACMEKMKTLVEMDQYVLVTDEKYLHNGLLVTKDMHSFLRGCVQQSRPSHGDESLKMMYAKFGLPRQPVLVLPR